MGNWYQHVTLKGVRTARVVAVMRELGRSGYVVGAPHDVVVAFDAGLDEMRSLDEMVDVPGTLSSRLGCPALFAGVYDDDALALGLYEGLERTFEYDSRHHLPKRVRHLCATLGRPNATRQVWTILSLPHFVPYLFESFRHLHVIRALGLPEWSAFTGYGTIKRNPGRPHSISEGDLVEL